MPYNPYSIPIGGINKLYSYSRLIKLLNEDDEDYDYPLSPVHNQFSLKDIHSLREYKKEEILELIKEIKE